MFERTRSFVRLLERVIELLPNDKPAHRHFTPPGSRGHRRSRHASNTCLINRRTGATFGAMDSSSDTPEGADSSGGRRGLDTSLTERQRTILDVIRASVSTRGYPPSIREIGDAVGLTSTSSVAHQLRTLERKGYLRRDPNRPRAVDVRGADDHPRLRRHHRRGGLRRATGADIRAGAGSHRRRRADSGRGGRRGRLPAAARTGRRRLAVPAQSGG